MWYNDISSSRISDWAMPTKEGCFFCVRYFHWEPIFKLLTKCQRLHLYWLPILPILSSRENSTIWKLGYIFFFRRLSPTKGDQWTQKTNGFYSWSFLAISYFSVIIICSIWTTTDRWLLTNSHISPFHGHLNYLIESQN